MPITPSPSAGRSPRSCVERENRVDDCVLLLPGHLRIDRERDHFPGRCLGDRQAAALVAQMREAGLQVQGQRVVDRAADARLPSGAPAARRGAAPAACTGCRCGCWPDPPAADRPPDARRRPRCSGRRSARAPRSTPRDAAAWPAAPRPAACPADCCIPPRRGSTAGSRRASRSRRSRSASASSCVTIMPPSPNPPRFLLGKNENVPTVPSSPAIRQAPSILRRAPIACAASSISGQPMTLGDREDAPPWPAICPNRWTTTIAAGARRDRGLDRAGRDVEAARVDVRRRPGCRPRCGSRPRSRRR